MFDESLVALFKNNALLQNLTPSEFKTLFSKGRKINLSPGEYLIKEGAAAEEFFFILKGNLEASNYDAASGQLQKIAFFQTGDLVGEMALVDKGARSADVIATTEAEVLAIAFKDWDLDDPKSATFNKILFLLAQNLSAKLRSSNVKNLEKQVLFFKNRLFFGELFISLIIFLCFIFFLQRIMAYLKLDDFVPYTTLFLTGISVIVLLYFSRKYALPWKVFGISNQNIHKSVFEALAFTVPVMAFIVFLKWVSVKLDFLEEPNLFSLRFQWPQLLIYILFVVPFQELIARGALQGLLMQFLIGKHKKMSAIWISTLIFSATHLVLSLALSLASLCLSLYCGWLYSRNENLVGVWVAHSLIGILAFNFLGFFNGY